jgi:hypothetical protein
MIFNNIFKRKKSIDSRISFRERLPVLQKKDDMFRRWFESDGMELIVWYNNDKSIYGFQLCYFNNGEHAITWKSENGFSHDLISNGDDGRANRSPILIADGIFPSKMVINEFKNKSTFLEKEIANLVLNKLTEYSASHSG